CRAPARCSKPRCTRAFVLLLLCPGPAADPHVRRTGVRRLNLVGPNFCFRRKTMEELRQRIRHLADALLDALIADDVAQIQALAPPLEELLDLEAAERGIAPLSSYE